MVSPNLMKSKTAEKPVELNDNTKKLFQVIYSEENREEEQSDNEAKIKVSELVSRLAFFYEKVRNAVDYEEDHLLRKNAIARILRRQVVIEGVVKDVDSVGLSTHLLTELIRGSYLPNNKIPETKIGEVARLLEKYLKLKDYFVESINSSLGLKSDVSEVKNLISDKNNVISWLLNMAACEIEENLAPGRVKQMIVNNMFDVLSRDVVLPKEMPYEGDREIQIYLSIGRSFLKLDQDMLNFVLFKYYNDDWLAIGSKTGFSREDETQLKKIAKQIKAVRGKVKEQLDHPLTRQMDRLVRRYSLYFNVLAETISEDPVKAYAESQKGEKGFLTLVHKTCEKKYKKAKSRLWRAAVRSIIYIFLTKSIFVFLIEVPAIRWFNEPLNPLSLAINVAFPALLLFFIVLMTQKPGEDNTDKIITGIRQIAFLGQNDKQPITLRPARKRNLAVSAIFNFVYTVAFFVSVYFIVRGLALLGFNWVSMIIFLFFLAFVSFFSIIVTRGIKELMIIERKENIVTFLIDLFYMPIILVGRWLSNNMSRVNIFVFIFDFIIEAPFKILVDVAEDWTKYVRERRDNMQ